jgi:hypothetical protein
LAEQAEKPDARMELKWQQALKDQQRTRNVFEQQFMAPQGQDPDLTALPQPLEEGYSGHRAEQIGETDTAPSSAVSSSGWDRRAVFARTGDNRVLTSSNNSSTASIEALEEHRPRPTPGSRDGKKNARLFDIMSSSARKKGKGDRGHAHDDGHDI